MATKEELKTYFQPGDRPTQQQFEELIEECYNVLTDDFYQPSDAVQGVVINNSNGVVVSSADFGISGKIPMNPSHVVEMFGHDPSRLNVHAYAADDSWLGLLTGTASANGTEFAFPATTDYIQCNIYQGGNTQYIATFQIKIKQELELVQQEGDKFFVGGFPLLPNLLDPIANGVDLFNQNAVLNMFINSADGVISALSPWIITNQIPVFPNVSYTASGQKTRFDIHQYDANGDWLGFVAKTAVGANIEFTPDNANVSYIQCNIAQFAADADVVNTLKITTSEIKLDAQFLPPIASSDQNLNTTSAVQFDSLSVRALSFESTEWDETGVAPIPVGQIYYLPNGTLKLRLV